MVISKVQEDNGEDFKIQTYDHLPSPADKDVVCL